MNSDGLYGPLKILFFFESSPPRSWVIRLTGNIFVSLRKFRVYTFNGETEYSTNLRPRGSPTSQLRRGVSFRSREMRPIFAISQRMRSIKGWFFIALITDLRARDSFFFYKSVEFLGQGI